jgi:hypothetical protein
MNFYTFLEANCTNIKGKRGGRKTKGREMSKKCKEEKTQMKETGYR